MAWLRVIPASAGYVNAYGSRAAINLAWSSSEKESRFPMAMPGMPKSPPPQPPIVPKSPPPIYKRNLPSGSKNQNPASTGPVGVRKRTENPGKPVLRCVVPDDLRSAVRLDALFAEAVCRGLVRESPVERLRFFAAAEHAQRVGIQNPCGLFVTVVRCGLWSHVSQADEDRALKRLRGWEADERCPQRRGCAYGICPALGGENAAGQTGHRDSITELVRELALLRSFDSAFRDGRNRPWGDDRRITAA
jgi:hypothetical protein